MTLRTPELMLNYSPSFPPHREQHQGGRRRQRRQREPNTASMMNDINACSFSSCSSAPSLRCCLCCSCFRGRRRRRKTVTTASLAPPVTRMMSNAVNTKRDASVVIAGASSSPFSRAMTTAEGPPNRRIGGRTEGARTTRRMRKKASRLFGRL